MAGEETVSLSMAWAPGWGRPRPPRPSWRPKSQGRGRPAPPGRAPGGVHAAGEPGAGAERRTAEPNSFVFALQRPKAGGSSWASAVGDGPVLVHRPLKKAGRGTSLDSREPCSTEALPCPRDQSARGAQATRMIPSGWAAVATGRPGADLHGNVPREPVCGQSLTRSVLKSSWKG